jgi:hypothetical protein
VQQRKTRDILHIFPQGAALPDQTLACHDISDNLHLPEKKDGLKLYSTTMMTYGSISLYRTLLIFPTQDLPRNMWQIQIR